jgi:hypothetical protein
MTKKLKTITQLCSLLITQLILISCSTVTYEKIYPTLGDGKYDSEFPYIHSSEELQKITETVQRINSTGFYDTYFFNIEDEVTLNDLHNNPVKNLAVETDYADQSSSGTATIIYHNEGKVALLTCAHVVNYPDTIVTYFWDAEGNSTQFLETVCIKDKQVIYAAGFPEGSYLEIITLDTKLDIAIIGRSYPILMNYKFPVFAYPTGKAQELDWGTFVYVFGYPMNYQMITKALVSSPNRDSGGSFLLDAVVNHGYSGGIVLAIKDGIPNFELVGIVQWVPKEKEYYLGPLRRKNNQPYNSLVPYEGESYVKRHSNIKYGIAKIIAIESIIEFLENNKSALFGRGYYLENFIKK